MLAICAKSVKNMIWRTDMNFLQTQYAVLIVYGVAFCLLITAIFLYFKYRKTKDQIIASKVLFDEKSSLIKSLQDKVEVLNEENSELMAQNIRMQSDIDNQKKYLEEKILFLEQNKEELSLRFKDISNQIIKAQNEQFGIEQKNTFSLLLKPFQEQMAEFKQKVEQTHEENVKNNVLFDKKIKDLLDLNKSLSDDARGLSNALKGNKKIQGNWGEFQLERVLEISGLQRNINYVTQETFRNEDNQMLRPDVIVMLPNDRKVIVDSKVSLNDYVAFVNSEDENMRKDCLKKHIQCIKNHIDELSSKEYQKLLKDSMLDYVVIFIPVESAYVEAVREDTSLYDYAYKKNIIITTPSSLLPILRTIENLWQIENRNKNVAKIAELGGALYDKISNFVEDMKRIDNAIGTSRKYYDEAIKKLSTGKGNALSLAGQLRDRGAKVSKTLSVEYEDNNNLLTDEVANG